MPPLFALPTLAGMSLFPDPPAPFPKPKLTAEERRARQTDQLMRIRRRMMIPQALDDSGITTSAAIGAALGMASAEATALLIRSQWREGDLLLLQAASGGG
jgi:hypothetical protein